MYPESYWNYRLIRYTVEGDDPIIFLEEVYYRNEEVDCWSQGGEVVMGTDPEEIGRVLDMMREALDKPILDKEWDKEFAASKFFCERNHVEPPWDKEEALNKALTELDKNNPFKTMKKGLAEAKDALSDIAKKLKD